MLTLKKTDLNVTKYLKMNGYTETGGNSPYIAKYWRIEPKSLFKVVTSFDKMTSDTMKSHAVWEAKTTSYGDRCLTNIVRVSMLPFYKEKQTNWYFELLVVCCCR